MITKSKNKMMGEAENKTAAPFQEGTEEFHFAGGMEYEPVAVVAKDRKEAEEIWLKVRKSIKSNNVERK